MGSVCMTLLWWRVRWVLENRSVSRRAINLGDWMSSGSLPEMDVSSGEEATQLALPVPCWLPSKHLTLVCGLQNICTNFLLSLVWNLTKESFTHYWSNDLIWSFSSSLLTIVWMVLCLYFISSVLGRLKALLAVLRSLMYKLPSVCCSDSQFV